MKCHDKPNRNAPFLRWSSCWLTVTLRQKKEKHILTRGQEHLILMMHWHHCTV